MTDPSPLAAALILVALVIALVIPLEVTHRRTRHLTPPTRQGRSVPQWW